MKLDYSVMIVGAAILIVPASEEVADFDDVVNGVLFAQLVANKQLEKQPGINWYDAYADVFDGFWLRQVKARQDRYLPLENTESVVEWVVAALANAGADSEPLVSEVLSRLINVSETDLAIKLLRSHVQAMVEEPSPERPMPATDVRLLIMVARSPSSLSSVFVEMKTRQVLSPNPLAHLFRGEDVEGLVSLRYTKANLSHTLYDPVRDDVALKIKNRIAANVALLTFADESAEANKS
jgi:hypothetical protein